MYSRLGNEGLIAILAQPRSSSPTIVMLTSDHHGPNCSYNSQVLRRKHPVLDIKLNPLSLLFQLGRYHRNNTNKRPQQWLSCFSKKPRVFSSFGHYAYAGVIARALILLVRSQTTRVFRIFVTTTRLINREFLVFPSVHFFKKLPHFLADAVPLYCPILVKICKS